MKSTRAATKRRRSERGRNRKSFLARKRSHLDILRLELGKAKALRDRILQHKDTEKGDVPRKLKHLFDSTQKKILQLERDIPKPTVADVRVFFILVPRLVAHACMILYIYMFILVPRLVMHARCFIYIYVYLGSALGHACMAMHA